MKRLYRFIPLLVIITGLIIFFASGLHQYLSFQTLQAHHAALKAWTAQHQLLAVGSFIGIYIIFVAISIPGAVWLTMLGGFLFGIFFGFCYAMIGATIGACLLFLAARTAIGDWLAKKVGGRLQRLEQGFQANAFSYLLFLRLVPVFPFWLVNIVPAIFNMRFIPYALATCIGIIPGSIIYVLTGNGLGTILAAGKTPDIDIIFHPEIITPIIGLALLSLVPILYRKLWKR